ncbi:twin-arginine translocase TatA/TatE family subunit [Nocardioides sp. YIM 152588]|uniref:Sec-independent protein translocase subunit TatA/TatB n=1 Tax=Nocardioides sp. YIM 152588 TaxID=3158259 RepID=UPI0032E4250D
MFGLTFEKLFLVAVIAGVVIGPTRLPVYAHRLGQLLRDFRSFLDASRARAESELGSSFSRADWDVLDPRRYDPRRIVRDALDDGPATEDRPATADPEREALLLEAAAAVRPGQKYLVAGSAAHPRRIRIDSLPPDDPRRIAAERPVEETPTGTDAYGAVAPGSVSRLDRAQ